jgi:hypothetical protein
MVRTMTYKEFEKSLVVDSIYRFMTDDMVAVELRFQAKCRQGINEFLAARMDDDTKQWFVENLKREFYDELFGPCALVDEFGMTEDEFVRWCRHKFYSGKIEEVGRLDA